MKEKVVFVCQECGAQSPKWMGRCTECGAWNSLVEERIGDERVPAGSATSRYAQFAARGSARLYADVSTTDAERLSTGIDEFDRVLGGGVVPGSLVLLGGEPGIGKSTLLLQAAAHFARAAGPVLYASGRSGYAGLEDTVREGDLTPLFQKIVDHVPAPNLDPEGEFKMLATLLDRDIKLTHYWKVVASPGDGWKPFTHLEGPNHQGYINADHAPVKGKYPASAWKVGDIVRDEHLIRLPANWASETLNVYVGFWRGTARLPVKSGAHDAEGRVLAAAIPVKVTIKPVARKSYVAPTSGTQ